MNFESDRVSLKERLFPDMPHAATPQEWHEWNNKAKESKFKWFIAETVPSWFAITFQYPYENFTSKLKNKYVRKHNLIKIESLKDDEWYDTDTRMMHGMFQLLVDFVELEKAHMEIVFNMKNPPKYMLKANYRSASAGLKYLEWESNLGKEGGKDQAKNAKITRDLYVWWKFDRPARLDLMDVKGSMGVSTNEFYDTHSTGDPMDMFGSIDRRKDKEPELYKDVNKAYEDAKKAYNKEDEKMLTQLIKLRKSLWT